MQNRATKQIAIVDTSGTPETLGILHKFLGNRYEFKVTSKYDADYVIHSCFGNEVLKYSGVRIFITGECVSPDFNISDYALAFDHLQFGDRYCRLPLIKLFTESYTSLSAPRPPAEETLANKTGFCAYVMSNTKNSAPQREQLFDALNTYKPVASGGKWRNNVGGPVADKIAFQSKYKFVLAIENAAHPGYLTEKFAQAAQSNAIPIYWGDPTITEQINPKAFINANDYNDFSELAETVRQLDSDDSRYLQMITEPWFPENKEPDALRDATYTKFLCNIFNQPHQQAYRRNLSRWGIKYEKRLSEMAFKPHVQFIRNLKEGIRKVRKKR